MGKRRRSSAFISGRQVIAKLQARIDELEYTVSPFGSKEPDDELESSTYEIEVAKRDLREVSGQVHQLCLLWLH